MRRPTTPPTNAAASYAADDRQARSERTGGASTTVPPSCRGLIPAGPAPMTVEPLVDLVGVEANEVPDLEVRDPPLGDEPAHVAHTRGDVARGCRDVEQLTSPPMV